MASKTVSHFSGLCLSFLFVKWGAFTKNLQSLSATGFWPHIKKSLQFSQNGATKLVPGPSSWPENFSGTIALDNPFLPIDQLESLVQNGERKIGQKPLSEGPGRNFWRADKLYQKSSTHRKFRSGPSNRGFWPIFASPFCTKDLSWSIGRKGLSSAILLPGGWGWTPKKFSGQELGPGTNFVAPFWLNWSDYFVFLTVFLLQRVWKIKFDYSWSERG
jgi:hypothetical protein